jgi:tRNA(Ile)-lysidine synthetase-like protein
LTVSTHTDPVGLPIDGRERATREGWTVPVRSPATGEPLWELPDAGPEDAQDAVEAAWRAVHATGWSTDGPLRVKALLGFREALLAESDRLAELLATETGVPVALRAEHVDDPVARLRTGPGRAAPRVTTVITPATSPLAVALDEIGRALVSRLVPARGYCVPRRPHVVAFDADALPGALTVRARAAGDRFRPFGGGERRLKTFLIDARVPRWERDRLPLVIAGGEIVWVGGVRRGAQAPVGYQTVRVLELALEPLAEARSTR